MSIAQNIPFSNILYICVNLKYYNKYSSSLFHIFRAILNFINNVDIYFKRENIKESELLFENIQ